MIGYFVLAMIVLASEPQVRTQEFTVEVPNAAPFQPAMVPMVQEYFGCLLTRGKGPFDAKNSREAAARQRITDCAAVRGQVVAKAVSVYVEEEPGGPSAQNYVDAAFKSIDEGYVYNAQQLDKMFAKHGKPPVTQPENSTDNASGSNAEPGSASKQD
jgi:hypothetical protein